VADKDGSFDWAEPDEEVHSLPLELLDQRRFGNGVVYLRYRTR